MSVLLLYPPTAKFCEPPAGIARLAGSLRDNDVPCLTVDLNLECMLQQFDRQVQPKDTWSRRAFKGRNKHLADLRAPHIYNHPDRYRRAVSDLNRVLALSAQSSANDLTLANFTDSTRSPVVSSDLLESAEQYDKNHFFSCFRHRIDSLIKRDSPQIIGISISYLSQALNAFAIFGYIKDRHPEITTIAGGGLITSWLSTPGRDELFRGLVDHLINGPGEQDVLNLAGKKISERIGRPDYDNFRLKEYLSPGMILPYAASDGCYWKKCTFCPDRAEGACFLQNSPGRVSRELAKCIERHKPVLLHFLDNALSPVLLGHLILSPPGIPWYGFTRVEKELENVEFCRGLKRAGCIMLKLGLESGSQKVLDHMNKGIELNRVSRVLDSLKAAGIATYVYLLFGTPHETEQDAVMTMNFVKKNHAAITFLNLAIFNMPACSPEAQSIPLRFSDGDLSLYCNFIHPFGWDRKSVRTFLHSHFKKDPLISRIIQRDPPTFTSNHAPLFYLTG